MFESLIMGGTSVSLFLRVLVSRTEINIWKNLYEYQKNFLDIDLKIPLSFRNKLSKTIALR